jgi:hypothetical protein
MAIIYEVTVINGKYLDKKTGEQKNSYSKIGIVMETKAGPMLKLQNIPIVEGGWNGMAYLNPPREKDGFPKDMDDDMPF